MSQDLLAMIARIENASPEYIAFRKEVLGPHWNDYENAWLLGPYELSRPNGEETEIAKCVFGETEEGDFLLYDTVTKQVTWIELPAGPWRNEFDQYVDRYIKGIDQLPAHLKVLYKEVIGEIKGYLANQYAGIAPKRSRFIEWFISQLPTPIIYMTGIRDAEKKARWHKTFGLRSYSDIFLTPESVEQSLHEYCHWKKGQQDKIYAQIVDPISDQATAIVEGHSILSEDEKLDIIINEFKSRTLQSNPVNDVPMNAVVDFFMQLTTRSSNDNKPFLSKVEFVDFLKRAFDGKESIPKIKANYAEGTNKSAVINLFYVFFEGAKGKYCAARNKKGDHLHLLTDNFEGFDFDTIIKIFNKYIIKNKWNTLSKYL